jgi:transposase
LRQIRYVGLTKARVGHLLTATALNFLRLSEWFADLPRAKRRRAPFVTLLAA